jgi:hypothetical protein
MCPTNLNYSDEIHILRAEITRRFGLCPSFFMLAKDSPELARQLWNLAQFAYLDNPLPSLFKEKLFTYLSRFCYSVPYCVARHLAFLVGLGYPSADAKAAVMEIDDVLVLLKQPISDAHQMKMILAQTASIKSFEKWPEPSSKELEWYIIALTTSVFTRRGEVALSQAELRRLLGPAQFDWLMLLVAFIRMAHFWTETHPELALEDDVEKLLRSNETFAEWLYRYRGEVLRELAT